MSILAAAACALNRVAASTAPVKAASEHDRSILRESLPAFLRRLFAISGSYLWIGWGSIAYGIDGAIGLSLAGLLMPENTLLLMSSRSTANFTALRMSGLSKGGWRTSMTKM